MSKRSRACEFNQKQREAIYTRDMGCIFCKMGYHNEELSDYERGNFQTMHYISRAQGGLGIEQNAAVGCFGHHMMMDNGAKGRREEMQQLMKEYLSSLYRNWKEEDLVYSKG